MVQKPWLRIHRRPWSFSLRFFFFEICGRICVRVDLSADLFELYTLLIYIPKSRVSLKYLVLWTDLKSFILGENMFCEFKYYCFICSSQFTLHINKNFPQEKNGHKLNKSVYKTNYKTLFRNPWAPITPLGFYCPGSHFQSFIKYLQLPLQSI